MAKKIMRKALELIPKKLRHSLMRNRIELPWETSEDIQFRLVENEEDFLGALHVLHDSYVHQGLMEPEDSGLRLTPFHLLPNTVMAVAAYHGKIIATMSVIRDNPMGLPMDRIFDLAPLRENGDVLCEVSELAIHTEFRHQSGTLIHPLIRFLWRYAFDAYGVDRFVIAVNHSRMDPYEAFYLFEPLTEIQLVDPSDLTKGPPPVALSLRVQNSYERIKQAYTGKSLTKNLYQFMQVSHHKTEVYPNREYFQVAHSFLTPIFFIRLRELFPQLEKRFDDETKENLAYQWGYDSFADIGRFSEQHRRFAFNGRVQIITPGPNQNCIARLIDVSRSGFKVQLGAGFLRTSGDRAIAFQIELGPQLTCTLVAKLIWRNQNGFAGFSLNERAIEWDRMIDRLERKPQATTITQVEKDLSSFRIRVA